ncbi:Demethylmenaquinone methyltransferase [Candidatus Desulfarcum epimagneticum]|uniref:Demethylmenaquinone methyltransferase n=1 Tax=uncultured Desulfobacteraceae bacterium TaxID=218296 RepID=A0A484HG10_9BACT|nr:Demethylmenaquinone methyltransferase [uncultured Desulfobacteraceae bacterium]
MDKRHLYEMDNATPGSRKRYIRSMFDSITVSYDRVNRVLSLGIDTRWRKSLVRAAGPLKDRQALDICCGSGAVSALLHREGARAAGLDFSRNMLKKGLEKGRLPGGAAAADACAMPFGDAVFDAAFIAFGIRNIPDLAPFMDEALRVLKPGGKLAILELSRPQNKIAAFFHSLYLEKIVPRIGGMISGKKSAYDYLAGTIATFIDPKTLQKMLEEKKFANCRVFPQTLGATFVLVCEKTKEDE